METDANYGGHFKALRREEREHLPTAGVINGRVNFYSSAYLGLSKSYGRPRRGFGLAKLEIDQADLREPDPTQTMLRSRIGTPEGAPCQVPALSTELGDRLGTRQTKPDFGALEVMCEGSKVDRYLKKDRHKSDGRILLSDQSGLFSTTVGQRSPPVNSLKFRNNANATAALRGQGSTHARRSRGTIPAVIWFNKPRFAQSFLVLTLGEEGKPTTERVDVDGRSGRTGAGLKLRCGKSDED
ncbi:hypothetical protein C8R46DRAFT_1047183 [Mycena filopes]|nr:hypothetical protein C8R46DRAFT_1047183 [Mycena filopes]